MHPQDQELILACQLKQKLVLIKRQRHMGNENAHVPFLLPENNSMPQF